MRDCAMASKQRALLTIDEKIEIVKLMDEVGVAVKTDS